MKRVKVDGKEGAKLRNEEGTRLTGRAGIWEWNTLPRIARIRHELIQKDYWDFRDGSGYLLFVDDVGYENQKNRKKRQPLCNPALSDETCGMKQKGAKPKTARIESKKGNTLPRIARTKHEFI